MLLSPVAQFNDTVFRRSQQHYPAERLQRSHRDTVERRQTGVRQASGTVQKTVVRLKLIFFFFFWNSVAAIKLVFQQHAGALIYGDRTSLRYWYSPLVACTTYVWATTMTSTVLLTNAAHSNAIITMKSVFGSAEKFAITCNFNLL